MGDSLGYILSAIVTGLFGIVIVILQIRAARATKNVHDEVRTNHGIRQGERIEALGDVVTQIQRTMVTKSEFQEHQEHDVKIAKELAVQNKETREILLAAIRVKGN